MLGGVAAQPLVSTVAASARQEIIWAGSYLRDPLLAEALRRKVLEGVNVYLLTSPYTYLDPQSYFLTLYLAGAHLYLGAPQKYVLVVDGVARLEGRGVGVPGESVRAPRSPAATLREVQEALAKAQRLTASPTEVVHELLRRSPKRRP